MPKNTGALHQGELLMQACEFNSVIYNGIIRVPEQYRAPLNPTVKIIMLFDDRENTPLTPRKKFSAMKLKTKGFKFKREDAHER
jgi:hypothetical protein